MNINGASMKLTSVGSRAYFIEAVQTTSPRLIVKLPFLKRPRLLHHATIRAQSAEYDGDYSNCALTPSMLFA